MDFADFVKYFTEVCICRIINTSVFSLSKTWSENSNYGKWRVGERAGGCPNNQTFLNNPQYTFDITSNDMYEEILVNLDQKSLRCLGKENLTFGFTLMKVEENRIYRLNSEQQKVFVTSFINTRSVCMRKKLLAGRYCVIPSTFEPNINGDFFLRIYTDNNCHLR
jgi:hypothetical protein